MANVEQCYKRQPTISKCVTRTCEVNKVENEADKIERHKLRLFSSFAEVKPEVN